MIKVFIVASEAFSDPITVFARDSAEAFRNYYLWWERHAAYLGDVSATVSQLTDGDLASQPQLALAAQSNVVGVGWWIGHRAGWRITAPDGDAIGSVAPPKPSVSCFVFHGPDCDRLYVFAEALERAIATFHL